MNTPQELDDAINDVAKRLARTLDQESETVLSGIVDRPVQTAVSNFFGNIMAAYGDAGYFVGLHMGLELAALTIRGELPRSAGNKKGRAR